MRPVHTLRLLSAALALTASVAQAGTVFSFPNFSSTAGLQLNGTSSVVGNELRLTPPSIGQGGSVFSTSTVSLAAGASFSTYFQFRFSSPGVSDGTGVGADGIAFVLQTVSNNVGGAGGGLGYAGIANSVAVEFDTWNNGGCDNNSSNHVGLDVNGSICSLQTVNVTEADMNNSAVWNAWIDYDASSLSLEVRLSQAALRPTAALMASTIDIASYLGSSSAYVGFTGATGAAWADQRILSWTLNDNFSPIGDLPEPGSLALVGFGIAGLLARRRRG